MSECSRRDLPLDYIVPTGTAPTLPRKRFNGDPKSNRGADPRLSLHGKTLDLGKHLVPGRQFQRLARPPRDAGSQRIGTQDQPDTHICARLRTNLPDRRRQDIQNRALFRFGTAQADVIGTDSQPQRPIYRPMDAGLLQVASCKLIGGQIIIFIVFNDFSFYH